MENRFSLEHHGMQEIEPSKERIDYSKFDLESDWYAEDESLNEVLESIREGDRSKEQAVELYNMFSEEQNMSIPDQDEGPTTAELEHSKKLGRIALALREAITETYPGAELKSSEFANEEYDI